MLIFVGMCILCSWVSGFCCWGGIGIWFVGSIDWVVDFV